MISKTSKEVQNNFEKYLKTVQSGEKIIILKKAITSDLPEIARIINSAYEHQKSHKIMQWDKDYIHQKHIIKEIKNSCIYLFLDAGNFLSPNKIMGFAKLIIGDDPTYEKIYDGKWEYNQEYLTIHKFAIAPEYRGKHLSPYLIISCEEIAIKNNISYMRIDTHHDNIMMQKAIEKADYEKSGIIYVQDGSPRIAYEKRLLLK